MDTSQPARTDGIHVYSLRSFVASRRQGIDSDLCDDDREQWMMLDADVKGDAYGGLHQKNAEDTKSGAGQYFTPRSLIRALVDVMNPRPGMTLCDPACGTGGFFLAAYEHIARSGLLDPDQKKALRDETFAGWEIVDNTARLCATNLLLHGLSAADALSPIRVEDALNNDPGNRFDMVLTNPPFGRKSSITIIGENGDSQRDNLTVVRDDFWATTSNKQLNFVQHVKTLLKDRRPRGRRRARQRAVRRRRWRDGSA